MKGLNPDTALISLDEIVATVVTLKVCSPVPDNVKPAGAPETAPVELNI